MGVHVAVHAPAKMEARRFTSGGQELSVLNIVASNGESISVFFDDPHMADHLASAFRAGPKSRVIEYELVEAAE